VGESHGLSGSRGRGPATTDNGAVRRQNFADFWTVFLREGSELRKEKESDCLNFFTDAVIANTQPALRIIL
jgi:hypothetical protein